MNWRSSILLSVLILAACASVAIFSKRPSSSGPRVVILIMDPMAKELACACVGRYAQRDYSVLERFLSSRLEQPVHVVFSESIGKLLALGSLDGKKVQRHELALIIGKSSVVDHDAREAGFVVNPIARLTDLTGQGTLTGLFVVRDQDPAKAITDLRDRRILFGPIDSEEKHNAAIKALTRAGVASVTPAETRSSCSEAALEVVESNDQLPPVAVISSYALPLLEGCGSIDEGALRVIGRTEPVPFITAFLVEGGAAFSRTRLVAALEAASDHPDLLKKLESRDGFVAVAGHDWPGWRGSMRDGQTAWLPDSLPDKATFGWKQPLNAMSMGGVAAAEGVVVVGDRDFEDRQDVFHCFRADTGEHLWRVSYPAEGKLDYGNSPRATPSIDGDQVFLLSAFGRLTCVDLHKGLVVWTIDLQTDFGAKPPKWGYCAAPLVLPNAVIVSPGAPEASVVALQRKSGGVLWKSPGNAAAYASFVIGNAGGRQQIVGYDAVSLGGWDPESGKRLWALKPPVEGDFNVPTPILFNNELIVSTENNGTRVYSFDAQGKILPKPVAETSRLMPDTSSPVLIGATLVGCYRGIVGLELGSLQPKWERDEPGFAEFGNLIASSAKVLATTFDGELWLFEPQGANPGLKSRLRVLEEGAQVYSHPALYRRHLFIRDRNTLYCLSLDRTQAAGP